LAVEAVKWVGVCSLWCQCYATRRISGQ